MSLTMEKKGNRSLKEEFTEPEEYASIGFLNPIENLPSVELNTNGQLQLHEFSRVQSTVIEGKSNVNFPLS